MSDQSPLPDAMSSSSTASEPVLSSSPAVRESGKAVGLLDWLPPVPDTLRERFLFPRGGGTLSTSILYPETVFRMISLPCSQVAELHTWVRISDAVCEASTTGTATVRVTVHEDSASPNANEVQLILPTAMAQSCTDGIRLAMGHSAFVYLQVHHATVVRETPDVLLVRFLYGCTGAHQYGRAGVFARVGRNGNIGKARVTPRW